MATRPDDSVRRKQVRPVAFMVTEIELYDLRSNNDVSGAAFRGLRGCWSAVSGQRNDSHNSALLMPHRDSAITSCRWPRANQANYRVKLVGCRGH